MMLRVVLTVNAPTLGHSEHERLSQLCFQSPLCELGEVGWENLGHWTLPHVAGSSCPHTAALALSCQRSTYLINLLMLQGPGKSSALSWMMD